MSTALIGREQSRHPFAVILLVTTLWRLPSYFAAMLFCADTITRRRCGARSKVKDHRTFVLIQLPVRVTNPNSVVFGLILTIMARFSRCVCVQNRFEPVSCSFFFFSVTFQRRHGIFHTHEKKHDPAFSHY